MPLAIAKLYANFFEIVMKNPLITRDQLTLLKYNNTASKLYKTNIDFNLNTNLKYFDQEIIKYSYMWKSGVSFQKKKLINFLKLSCFYFFFLKKAGISPSLIAISSFLPFG